jgi:methyl-accepting chemotaxis protein
MNWHSLKIRHKLFLGFGIVLTVTALFGGIFLSGVFSINKSSRSLVEEHIPVLSKSYDLQNYWQQAIFNLRTFSSQKDEQYFTLANNQLQKAREILDSLQTDDNGDNSSKWDSLKKKLADFQQQVKKSHKAELLIDQSYKTLDSAQHRLQALSDHYLHLQYKKLKRDVDNKEANYIIKRRVDKINLMNEIVNTAENLKITIGEINYRNDTALLVNLIPSLDIIKQNIGTILPMTTKQYDIKSLNGILDQAAIFKTALKSFRDNWLTLEKLNNHDFLEQGLSLTRDMAEKQEAYLINSAQSNLQEASSAGHMWWWSISLSLITGILLAWSISRSLADPLLNLTNMAELQADGILISIPDTNREDEIGKLTRSMKSHQEQTNRIIGALTNMGTSLNDLIQRLKNKSDSLSETTTTQAYSAKEITASVEEMQSLTESSSAEAENTSRKIQEAQKDVLIYIKQNRNAIDHMQQLINRSAIISELASQTYILSINALIEASRAKIDNTKGFATIARAMRDLAERVKLTVEDLNGLTAKGQQTSDEAIKNLDRIYKIISYNGTVLKSLAAMSLQQNMEVRQISSSIQQLNIETQSTAQLSEELTDEADRLRSHADELQEILSFYKKQVPDKEKLPKVNHLELAALLTHGENENIELKKEEVPGC